MTVAAQQKPFGLRDVKIKLWTGGTLGSFVDLPDSQIFKFGDRASFTNLRGDDKVSAIKESEQKIEWELESGGISLEAYKILCGGAVATTGTPPNEVKTFSKKSTDTRPYFLVEGQAISESGGDMHGSVFKCKCTDLEGQMGDGEFWVTKCKGEAIAITAAEATTVGGSAAEYDIYHFIANETATAIS